ncbi:MAG: ATP-binding domain-containing protein, partial [candidate division Zixibacteria bacterium]|nr:ATP-binding domain-containing protein [candidate division Zixibacteria bacterium]
LLIEEDPVMGKSRGENIDEFIAAAVEFVSSSTEPTLVNFLAEISLYTDLDKYNEIDDKLSLMTLHSAKGLEFMAIFMVGLEDGLFPLGRAIEDPMELEEERRLFYVGATRAKRNLFLSMASSRGRYGEMGAIPSRFIKELPPGLVETKDNRHYQSERSYNSYQSHPKPQQPKATVKTGVYYEYEEEEVLRPGCIVQHPTFGRGKVINVEGAGESLRLEIFFTGVGQKRIMAKFARLKVIG